MLVITAATNKHHSLALTTSFTFMVTESQVNTDDKTEKQNTTLLTTFLFTFYGKIVKLGTYWLSDGASYFIRAKFRGWSF